MMYILALLFLIHKRYGMAMNLGSTKMRMADFTIPKKPKTLASRSLEFSILATSITSNDMMMVSLN